MNHYDIWKTAEPEYLAGNPPCECGHEYDDHWQTETDEGCSGMVYHLSMTRPPSICDCAQYEPAEAEE